MITIIVDTKDEYAEMKLFAYKRVCIKTPVSHCIKQKPGGCETCFANNHAKCNIRIIPPVDNDKPAEL